MKNKWLFDLLPVILFFVAFRLADIYVATAVAIATSAAQIGWLLIRRRPIDTMQWVGLVIIVVFGGMTLLLHDESFIKWKPTILYWCFTAALGVASLLARHRCGSSWASRCACPTRSGNGWTWRGAHSLR